MKKFLFLWVGLFCLCLTGCPKLISLNQRPSTPVPTANSVSGDSGSSGGQKVSGRLVEVKQPESSSAAAAPAPEKKPDTYLQADRSPPQYQKVKEKCITSADGRTVCGFDCKTVDGHTKCAKDPRQRCLVGPGGQIACGFDCKKTDTSVRCGRYLYDNCVSNSLGEVECGNNCYVRDDDELICGK